MGDPIEAQALLATYGQSRPEQRPLWLGSIKSNIGHTQAAAGVAAVIKMVMALQHELLPETLHVDEPSRQVNWSAGSVALLSEARAWQRGEEPRRAAVSSFGVSGTNAHVILEEADSSSPSSHVPSSQPEVDVSERSSGVEESPRTGLLNTGVLPLIVSARNEAGLSEQASRLSGFSRSAEEVAMADVGLSLTRRSGFDRRAVSIGGERSEILDGLDAIASGLSGAGAIKGELGAGGPGGTVFVFPGQGSQWAGMALELLDCSSLFADSLKECGEAFAPFIDWSVEDVLRGVEGAPSLERIDVVQPVLFAMMVALAGLWEACGVRPEAVVGHSQGEIAAAHIAGGLSLADAARVVGLRSRMFTALVGRGGVASVAMGVEDVRERIARWGERISIAGVNGPRSVAVAGDRESLTQFLEECAAADVRAREIPATVASHSVHVEGLRDELLEALSTIEPRSSDISFYSTVTGGLLDTAELDARYWYRNLREPVEFERATRALLAAGYRTFVEVSPHPVLTVGLHETIEDAHARTQRAETPEVETQGPAQVTQGPAQVAQEPAQVAGMKASTAGIGVHGSLRRGDGGPRRFLTSLSELWVRGVDVDWGALFDEIEASPVQLPTYAFQRRRYWLEAEMEAHGDLSSVGQIGIGHPILRAAVTLAEGEGWLFTGRISLEQQPWFADHVVGGTVVVPGTTFVEVALQVGSELDCEALEDLVFETPLVLPARGGVRLQVTLAAADESGRRAIGIFSLSDGSKLAGEEGSWTRHARGVLRPAALWESPQVPTPLEGQGSLFAAGAWPPPGAEPVDVDDLYDYFAGVGLEYGPNFLCVQRAWRRGDEAFTEVRLPESQDESAGRFKIHPALLDCALQAGGVLMRTENDAIPENAVLPFAWSRVRIHARGCSSLRVRLSRLEGGGMSMLAADEQGRPVLSAESVVVRKIAPGQLRSLGEGDHRSLFHLEWVAASPGARSSSTDASAAPALIGEHTLACIGGL
ncbi:MAG TPA: type I polyketide synthase, partial [Solirubrobacteraceae bacterium]|nr:type I polyketide synthase [Solirubrobacteraceae bacterium]